MAVVDAWMETKCLAVHVHDVVTDNWSYALAGFLVSTLFQIGVSPGQS